MVYPCPGMNPWLEDVRLWRGVHTRLINALSDALAPVLEPRYFVDVETHIYAARRPDMPSGSRYPALAILDRGGHAVAIAPMVAMAMPIEIDLGLDDAVEEPYLEVRLVPGGDVVTVIELLSHTNKMGGRDRASYLQKRKLFFDSALNFVEIDLLRMWDPMPPCENVAVSDYRILVRRNDRRKKGLLYSFNVRAPIPVFPLPLLPDDEEPPVDLGAILRAVYERARY
jgi:hypothetical protein